MAVVSALFHTLDWFRIHWAGRPLLLCMAASALLVLVLARRRTTGVSPRVTAATLTVFGLAGLAFYIGVVLWYSASPRYYDYAEPTVTAVGWLYHLGKPVYHTLDSAERYAHMWGPMSFITHGWALGLFGPSIAASKWVGGGAALASIVLTIAAMRSVAGTMRTLVLAGVCANLFLIFRNLTFWTRPDPLQVLCVAATLVLALYGRRLWVAIVVGLLSGVLWNLKFTGPLYSLPVFAILLHRAGWTSVAVAAVVGALAAAAPFVLLPNVSWTNYATWVQLSASNGLGLATLRQNIEWALYFGWPILLSYFAVPAERRPAGGEWRTLITALGAGAVGVVFAAAKPGAGPYHLVPFLPVIAYVTARHLEPLRPSDRLAPGIVSLTAGFICATAILALTYQSYFLFVMADRSRLVGDDVGDLQRFLASHSGTMEMGYGSSPREYETFTRPLLVFKTGTYLLDSPAVQEHQLAGLDLPASSVEAIRECRAEYFLLPRRDDGWSQRNRYPVVKLRPLYPDEFRRAFEATYRRVETTASFEVWQCQPRIGR